MYDSDLHHSLCGYRGSPLFCGFRRCQLYVYVTLMPWLKVETSADWPLGSCELTMSICAVRSERSTRISYQLQSFRWDPCPWKCRSNTDGSSYGCLPLLSNPSKHEAGPNIALRNVSAKSFCRLRNVRTGFRAWVESRMSWIEFWPDLVQLASRTSNISNTQSTGSPHFF